MNLNSKMDFGTYKNKTVKEIIDAGNGNYLIWMHNNSKFKIKLDSDVFIYLNNNKYKYSNLYDFSTLVKCYTYKGFEIIKYPEVPNGSEDKWCVPELYYFKYANEISKGFKTVSKLQCEEAIDRYFNLNRKLIQELE
jgi:hypothetical protein